MANQIVVSAGAKVRNLDGVLTATSGVVSSVPLGAANGVATLDSGGKVPVSQLPSSVVTYLGTWNATTNTPTLVNGTGDAGDMYICNVAGTVNFGAGPITFAVGDWVLYGSGTWQKSNGQNGTVTSVGASITGDAVGLTGSPITTAGTLAFAFAGTNLQYVNGAGNLTTFPTLITSIGLSMPSAFSVANSPLTANGTIAVTGAGYASQYIRGDGTLADFPSSGGGGSSVSYYLNGGTSQGTIGGTTYYEMSKTADTGTGVDFTKSGDGLIVAFLTDANDPAQLNIPAGNWSYEIYASMSANGGTPQMYAELYKYDGTTFTLISTSSNEILYDGTNLNLYTFGMTVPATTLTLTDRLAIKLYATNSGGKTTTVHTQDSHLCQVITTFSTGITALNGLTAQVQYFATGTSGTDFNISSTTATHTFNLPTASATNRGALSSADWSTFNGKENTLTFYSPLVKSGSSVTIPPATSIANGYLTSTDWSTFNSKQAALSGTGFVKISGTTISYDNSTYYLASNPSAFITLTSLSAGAGISYNNTTGVITNSAPDQTVSLTAGAGISVTGTYPSFTIASTITQYTDALARASLSFAAGSGAYNSTTGVITIPTNNNQITNGAGYITGNQTITLSGDVSGSGTTAITTTIGALKVTNAMLAGSIDLTTKVTGLLPDGNISSAATWNAKQNAITLTTTGTSGAATLVGATLNIPQYTDTYTGTVTSVAALTIGTTGTDLSSTVANSTTTPVITLNVPTASATNRGALSSADWTTFNNKQSALTNPVLASGTWTSGYLPKINGTYTIGNSGIFDNSGNIGIGTISANAIFEIGGLVVDVTKTVFRSSLAVAPTAYYNDITAIYSGASAAANKFIINYANGYTSGTGIVLQGDGNVGIGISAPLARLHILAPTNDIVLRFQQQNDSTSQYYFNIDSTVNGALSLVTNYLGGTAVGFSQSRAANVSIGTTTDAGYKLDVNGTGRFSSSASTNLVLQRGSTSYGATIDFSTSTTNKWFMGLRGLANEDFYIYNQTAAANNLILSASTGAATFSSSVTATTANFAQTSANSRILVTASGVANTVVGFNNSGSTVNGVINNAGYIGILQDYPFIITIADIERFRIASTGAATFSSSVTSNGYFALTTTSDAYATQGTLSWNSARGTVISGKTASVYDFAVYGAAAQSLIANPTGTSNISFPSGNVLIGTTTDSGYKLDVNGTGRFSGALTGTSATFSSATIGSLGSGSNAILDFATNASGSPRSIIYRAATAFIDITNTAGTAVFQLSNGGAATFSSSVTATSFFESSSIKGKDIIATNPLLALDIDVIKYTRKSDESKDIRYGYSAEQIHSLMPELTDKDVTAVKYLDVHTILIAQLQKEIKELKAKLN